jgi:hypothetical protein
LRRELRAEASELDALREEVRKAEFAEANDRERVGEMEEELAGVRAASAQKESEEDAALSKAFPFV